MEAEGDAYTPKAVKHETDRPHYFGRRRTFWNNTRCNAAYSCIVRALYLMLRSETILLYEVLSILVQKTDIDR